MKVTELSQNTYYGDMDHERLELAICFLNSRDGTRDMFASASRARRWLDGETFVGIDEELRRLLPAMVRLTGETALAERDVLQARAVRDALLSWIDGERFWVPSLKGVSVRIPPDAAFPSFAPASSGLMALAEHAVIVLSELHVAGVAERLRRCQAEDCRWVFFDRSRNHSKVWCDMSGCGSRSKARAYRARRSTLRTD